MFKRNKHVFTCPDVIYLRNRQKKLNRISIALNVAFFGGMWLAGDALERRDARKIRETLDTPTETQE